MFNTRNIKYYFLFFILLFAVLAPAQRKKKNVIAKTKTSIPVTRNGIYESLLQSTAKVMFVDSIVVDKDNFLQFIPQPKEMGTISLSKDSFGLVQYQNELGDRRFFAVGDTAASDLKIQTSLGSSWGEPSCTDCCRDCREKGRGSWRVPSERKECFRPCSSCYGRQQLHSPLGISVRTFRSKPCRFCCSSQERAGSLRKAAFGL